MNKKVIITVIVVLLLAAGGYYLKSRTGSTTTSSQTVGSVVKESAEWAKAIESGKPTSCVMTKDSEKMEYYIEGKKMRADITSTVEGKTQLSHMINDSTYLYIWTEGQVQGSKTAIPSEDEVKQMTEDANKYQESDNTPDFTTESAYDNLQTQGYTIDCRGVSAESSKLTPPVSITFIDPSEMMKKITPADGSGIDMEKLQEMAKQYQDN